VAFAWADTFVAANAVGGMSSGDHTAIDEWPWTSDVCFVQHGSGGSGTVTFTFDMSAGPGDKKGFWVWFRSHVDNGNGYSITETRLTDGTSTLWTDSSPGISVTETTFASSTIRVFPIPDAAFSGDPDIDTLVLEFDVLNLNAGNNRFRFSGMRMSKSPFTAAQEADVPSSLSGADFSCYLASDLGVLGAADTEAVVVWPDSSGNGRHLIRKTGTGSLYETDTIDYVSFPNPASIFFGYWGSRVTGNHIWHTQIYPEDTTTTQGVFSYNSSFAGVVDPPTDPNDKNILGIDDEGSGDKLLLMSGVGDAGSHKYGATTVTFDAWVRVTEWIQDSGNEHLWLNDDATPDVDAASGSNNMVSVTVGNRESEDRPFQGRMAEFWWIDGASFTETNVDDARDVWVNGAGGTPGTASPAAISASLSVPASSPAGGGVVAPAATSAALTIPASSPAGGGVSIPAATSPSLVVPAVSPSGGAVAGPSVIPTSLSLLAAAAAGGAAAAPGVIPTSFTIPQVSPAGGAAAEPAALAFTVTAPQASPAGGAVAGPNTVGLSFGVNAPTVAGGAVSTPGEIGLVFTIPGATPETGGAGSASPAVTGLSALVNAAAASGGGVVEPDSVVAVLTVPGPTVQGPAAATPNVLGLGLTLTETVTVGPGVVSPDGLTTSFLLPDVTVTGTAATNPDSLALVVSIPGVVLVNTDGSPTTQEGELSLTFQEGGLTVSIHGGGLTVSEQSSGLKVSQ
jgi:hypothetical protein